MGTMKMTALATMAGALLCLPSAATANDPEKKTEQKTETEKSQTSIDADGVEVLTQLHEFNNRQISMAELAQDKAENGELSGLSKALMNDYQRLDENLVGFAKGWGIDLGEKARSEDRGQKSKMNDGEPGEAKPPMGQREGDVMGGDVTGVDREQQKELGAVQDEDMARLKDLTGAEFTNQYIDWVESSHQQQLTAVQGAFNKLEHDRLKKFLDGTALLLRENLRQVQNLKRTEIGG